MKFARLFESEKHGQILILKETSDDDEPMLKVMFDPEMEEVETFTVNYYYENEKQQQRVFDKLAIEPLEKIVEKIVDGMKSNE